MLAMGISSCKKENLETFEPVFKFELGGVEQKIDFGPDFLTNSHLQFFIEGDTRLNLMALSADRNIELGFRLDRPEAYWKYYLGNVSNAESRAYLIMNTGSAINKYYTGGGLVQLTGDEVKNTRFGKLAIRSGTFDMTLYDDTGSAIHLENGFFSLPYKTN